MKNKLFNFVLSVCLIITCAFLFTACDNEPEKTESEIVTSITEQHFVVGSATEFTFSTIANDNEGVMVYGVSNFNDESAIQLLEYKYLDTWIEYPRGENYGSPVSGFPLTDATDVFRVTFSKAGTYVFSAFIKTFDGDVELCRVDVEFTVYEA